MDLLEQLNIPYLVVAKPYTPALQDIQMMDSLYQMDIAPLDWIIVADTDELFTYGTTSLAEATQLMEADGATFALGEMLDHVAKDGSLAGLQARLLKSWTSVFPTLRFCCAVKPKIAMHALIALTALVCCFTNYQSGFFCMTCPASCLWKSYASCKAFPCLILTSAAHCMSRAQSLIC